MGVGAESFNVDLWCPWPALAPPGASPLAAPQGAQSCEAAVTGPSPLPPLPGTGALPSGCGSPRGALETPALTRPLLASALLSHKRGQEKGRLPLRFPALPSASPVSLEAKAFGQILPGSQEATSCLHFFRIWDLNLREANLLLLCHCHLSRSLQVSLLRDFHSLTLSVCVCV